MSQPFCLADVRIKLTLGLPMLSGAGLLLGIFPSSEISAHWISDFFLESPTLRLPSSAQEAFDVCEAHNDWFRAKYPKAPIPDGAKWFAFMNELVSLL